MRTMEAFLSSMFFVILIALPHASPESVESAERIEIIYVYHSAFGQKYPEFKIDLLNMQLWKFTRDPYTNFVPRDPSSENEGYRFAGELSEDKVKAFLTACDDCELSSWEELYFSGAADGHQWGITVVYSDSIPTLTQGSNAYPDIWDKMRQAFLKLTDEDILLFASDWQDRQAAGITGDELSDDGELY